MRLSKMEIYNSKKVIKVFASIETNCGDFNVYPNGYIERWNDSDNRYDEYDEFCNHHAEILEAGLKTIGYD